MQQVSQFLLYTVKVQLLGHVNLKLSVDADTNQRTYVAHPSIKNKLYQNLFSGN